MCVRFLVSDVSVMSEDKTVKLFTVAHIAVLLHVCPGLVIFQATWKGR